MKPDENPPNPDLPETSADIVPPPVADPVSLPAEVNEPVCGPRVRNVVIDTSLFVNPDIRTDFGSDPTEAFREFLSIASRIRDIQFYMPPSVIAELLHFADREPIPPELFLFVIQKTPQRYSLQFPAAVLYELIQEVRDRVNKGLRIAESAIRATEKRKADEIIQDTRRKYRDALREGIIDSKEDVDLLLLAYELEAILVTADKGLILWAEKFGISWLIPEHFRDFLSEALRRSVSQVNI